jgi:carbamoyltransferase
LDRPSPYKLLLIPVQHSHIKPLPSDYYRMELYDRLYHLLSDIPSVTHVDYPARIQSVNKKTNPRYWGLINEFKTQTEFGLLVNSSFNERGKQIVCSPDDAFGCFMHTEMDYLVIGDFLFDKKDQAELVNDIEWRGGFKLG